MAASDAAVATNIILLLHALSISSQACTKLRRPHPHPLSNLHLQPGCVQALLANMCVLLNMCVPDR